MILVIFISIAKEGVEDIKRHSADAKVNSRLCKVVLESGKVQDDVWSNLHVGSIVLLFGDDEVPADVVTLVSGGIQGNLAYVETAAIDGETNLKVKSPALSRLSNEGSPNTYTPPNM